MNLRFIHSRFEQDLSNYPVSIVEENNWFSDQFFSRYTFPIELYITPELNAIFKDILDGNSASAETLFKGEFYYNNQVYDAVYDIEEIEGLKASVNIRFGLEEIPNYNKQLSDLPLEEVDLTVLPESIYVHAESIITQTYPAVNYNFVMAHTNQFDTDTTQWEHFQGVINKRVAGSFIENEFDDINNIQYNRNVMIPQPYIMHVLKTGIEDAGYTFEGNFKDQPDFKKAVLSEISEYYKTFTAEQITLEMTMDESISVFSTVGPFITSLYEKTWNITSAGRYKLAGNVNIRKGPGLPARIKISLDDIIIHSNIVGLYLPRTENIQLDFNFNYYSGPGVIKITSRQLSSYPNDDGIIEEELSIVDLTVTQIATFDGSGDLVSTLVEPTKIKLNECVPKMTFGELLNYLKQHKNIDIDIIDKGFYINSVNSQLEEATIFNLTPFEIKHPLYRYTKGDSFELKFKEITSENYSYSKLFINNEGLQTDTYTTDEKTTEIVINGLPLPLINKDGITTADHFLEEKSIPKIILYDGSVATNNVAEENTNLLLPYIYVTDYTTWLAIRIFSKETSWNFIVTDEKIRDLYIKNHVYHKQSTHIIKSINKDLLRPGLWNVDIEIKQLP